MIKIRHRSKLYKRIQYARKRRKEKYGESWAAFYRKLP